MTHAAALIAIAIPRTAQYSCPADLDNYLYDQAASDKFDFAAG